MATLERAIEIAAKHHAGQVDAGGNPYILHPLAVMSCVDGLDAKIAAVLHDIIEDTPILAGFLLDEGFSHNVVSAVIALTTKKGMTRIDAAHQAKEHPVAKVVKLAEIAENMDLSRIPHPGPQDYERLKEYEVAKAILEGSSAE